MEKEGEREREGKSVFVTMHLSILLTLIVGIR